MNKHARNIALFPAAVAAAVAATLIALVGMASCSNESIFASIESEVKLKDPSITGTVTNVAVFNGNTYAANGRLMRKLGTGRDWERMELPAGVSRCAEVASSGGALFGLFQDADWSNNSLMRFDGTTWATVATGTRVIGIRNGSGSIYAFREDTADYTQENIDAEYSVVTISGTSVGSILASGLTSRPTAASGGYFATTTAVYNGGSALPTTGDAPTAGIRGIAVDGGILYAATSGYVHSYTGGAWTRFPHDVNGPVTGLAWLKNGTKNVLLIAGNEGYGEVVLDGSDAPVVFQWPGEAATSSISTDARKEYKTNVEDYNTSLITVVEDGTVVPAGDAYVLYLGVIDKDYDGLWGYYQTTQPVWNRE